MNISSIINDISPLYNHYKENRYILSGKESIALMWDIGLILEKNIISKRIAPHSLFREIYGKSEGIKNRTQKSYITREFLSRCYRIKKIFSSKSDINQTFPELKKFTIFREAMPFFDNKKYLLKGEERQKLLNLMNSDLPISEILLVIKRLQKSKINISNSRKQRLKDLQHEKEIFISFYNYIYNLLKYDKYSFIKNELEANKIELDFLDIIIKNTVSIAREGLKNYKFEIPKKISGIWLEYSTMIKRLVNRMDEKERRRFRRLISPERIIKLSDYIYFVLSENNFNKFKEKN